MSDQGDSERILWEAYPAWSQFSWLHFFSLWTGSRGLLFWYAEIPGAWLWMVGAIFLLGIVGILRYWARYVLTSQRVIIRNGYTGKNIRCVNFDMIHSVEITQGPLAKIFGIGTLVIRCLDANRTLRFRGINHPEIVETKLQALLPATSSVWS